MHADSALWPDRGRAGFFPDGDRGAGRAEPLAATTGNLIVFSAGLPALDAKRRGFVVPIPYFVDGLPSFTAEVPRAVSHRVKLLSAAAVLTAGLVLALRFPKNPAADLPTADAGTQGLTYRSEPAAASALDQEAEAADRARAETGPGGAGPGESAAAAVEPVAQQRPADVAGVAQASPGAGSPATGVGANGLTVRRQPAAVPRPTHTIRDGDTLAGIAQQYLGQNDRAYEIFQLNRDRLVSVDLLPIGTVLRLPPKQAAPRTSAEHSRLVPIPAGVFARPVATSRQVGP